MKWLLIYRQQYSENSAEYGFGDYPEQLYYIAGVVEADTERRAQHAAKKLDPGIRFGGQFSPLLIQSTDEYARLYIAPADSRLSAKAADRHWASLAALEASP